MELTNQMYPVKDVDSFVEALVERFLDLALWRYKLEGNLELRPIFERIRFGGNPSVIILKSEYIEIKGQ